MPFSVPIPKNFLGKARIHSTLIQMINMSFSIPIPKNFPKKLEIYPTLMCLIRGVSAKKCDTPCSMKGEPLRIKPYKSFLLGITCLPSSLSIKHPSICHCFALAKFRFQVVLLTPSSIFKKAAAAAMVIARCSFALYRKEKTPDARPGKKIRCLSTWKALVSNKTLPPQIFSPQI